ncbi:tetraacyldisaccharide 4'-kinase [Rickettsiales endosymbiont of Trichoplax sp. H2]|uniref:tetraacyldisaccharide 4'-kinase n=1 Tax=Rickettsiales endosymbiont of Trichoplax sp. H2 TaxID=2021221 RepID=UPI0012B43492|nr:tetraacyldisaccharide 4'-kinase [Rickettsiales endosymbiont of Trichoplax sp. H2]MSO14143.1 Tetraacyldisaccharide 4'-kinase [Rickettsiales endosymbiont of Trichoplax sp. H2]
MNLTDKLANYIQNSLWSKVSLINYMLLPLSILYSLIRNLRYYFYQTPIKFNSKIICVGNSISGGAGKTPIVIRLAELLSQNTKLKIAVVAKGYKGNLSNNSNAIKVSLNKHTCKEVGDEALLIAKHFPVYISNKRKLAIELAQKDGAETIILDDGFQNNSINKDISILAINNRIFNHDANNLLIPAGPLRESLKTSIRKADIIITSGKNTALRKNFNLSDKLLFFQNTIIKNPEEISGKKFILLCGIAQPERVVKTAKNLKANILKSYFFPDHYNFSSQELESLYKEATKFHCNILTTKKDFVRIDKKFHKLTTVIDYAVEINDEKKLIKKILTL